MNTSGKLEITRGANTAFTSLSAALVLALGLAGAGCAVDGEPASVSTFGPGVATTAPSSSSPPPASSTIVEKAHQAPAPALPSFYVNPTGSGETVTVYVQNVAGATIALIDGSSITIPPGALTTDAVTLTVTASTKPAPSQYQAVSPMFVFGPSDVTFAHPVTITMPVTVDVDANTADYAMMWSRPAGASGYEMLATSYASETGTDYIASAQTTHLGSGMCIKKASATTNP